MTGYQRGQAYRVGRQRSLVISGLDYCNGILTGAPADLLNRLDGVLRGAARLILKRQRSDHINDSMREQVH